MHHSLTTSPLSWPCACGCSGTTAACADPLGLERTRYFPRMLVGADELTQDQRYVRDRLRRHNRLLHGWGVVCGCDVRPASGRDGSSIPWTVVVDPGFVLGPFGDEIVVDQPVTLDVRSGTRHADECGAAADPWCADVRVERRPERPLYVGIRYDEVPTRPIRTVAGCSCGCDEAECEYSRIRDSFVLATLEELPAPYRSMKESDAAGARQNLVGLRGAVVCSPEWDGSVRPCPPCPDDPWVLLADLKANADGGLQVNARRHRRYVASFADYAFSCPK